MTRFQMYLLLLLFAMCALLLQTGIPYSWRWKVNSDSTDFQLSKLKNSIGFDVEKTSAQNSNIIQRKSKSIEEKNDQTIHKHETNAHMRKSLVASKLGRKSIKSLPFLQDIDSYPPWSYDRFMANITLFVKQRRNQKEIHSLLSSAFNPLNSLPLIQQSNVSRVLLFAYFRSGSTFLGDLLQQNWKSFYTFEPLHYMSDGVRIDDNRVEEASNLIDKIFRCDFTSNYVEWVRKTRNQFLFKWNKFLWGICRFRLTTCFDPIFIRQTCQRAKVHIMKVARLQMRHMQTLLPKINDLNVNIVYLVRDPRGTLKSRQNVIWCTQNNNCSDIVSLCHEMREDLNSFKQLKKAYPSKFTLIRFEDLSTDPIANTKLLLNKFGIPYSASVRRFLTTHTNSTSISTDLTKRNPYTTIRNSKSVAYEWMQTLNMTDILQVQNICGDLLQELGYKFIGNNTNTINTNNTINSNQTKFKL